MGWTHRSLFALTIVVLASCYGETLKADPDLDAGGVRRDAATWDGSRSTDGGRSDAQADAQVADATAPVDARAPDGGTDAGPCGVCVPGDAESRSCSCGGTQMRSCDSSCAWGSWGSCEGMTGCTPGSSDTRSCSCGGTQTRSCSSSCAWGSWGSCEGMTGCTPGAVQTRSCDCGSGSQRRTCSSSCRWGAWRACSGGAGYPVSPTTGASVCPPYSQPAVFLVPHPDDEAIGMAGAIREHVLAGRTVIVEVMTHGEATGAISVLDDGGTHSWHSGSHRYSLTSSQVGTARLREFRDAVGRLGAHGLHINNFGDGNLTVSEVSTRIRFWTGLGQAGLSLKGTAGSPDPTSPGGTPHRDHAAVWDALLGSGFGDVRGYLVYHYGSGAGSYSRVDDISSFCSAKRNALAAYRVWNPGAGRYAIGYHSVASLIDAAAGDCREYVVIP